MTFNDLFNVCRARGVRLVVNGSELRAQARKGIINGAMREGLAEHKQQIVEMFGDGIWPDETLPDVIIIPARTPNTLEAIRTCIDAQRVKQAA